MLACDLQHVAEEACASTRGPAALFGTRGPGAPATSKLDAVLCSYIFGAATSQELFEADYHLSEFWYVFGWVVFVLGLCPLLLQCGRCIYLGQGHSARTDRSKWNQAKRRADADVASGAAGRKRTAGRNKRTVGFI